MNRRAEFIWASASRCNMKQGISQQTNISQQLAMTPRLAEAIALLAMPMMELSTWIREQLESNPMLEEEENPETAPLPTAEITPPQNDDTAEESDTPSDDYNAMEELERWDWQEYFDAVADGEAPQLSEPAEEDYYSNTPDSPPDLAESLFQQLKLRTSDQEILSIAYEIIGSLSDIGYLTEPLSEMATRLGKPQELLESILQEYIQTLEPTGVGARNLEECLRLQLVEQGFPPDDLVFRILEHLEIIPEQEKLVKLLKANTEDVSQAVATIRSLNPKPGLAFGTTQNQDAVPEIFVRLEEGKPVITLDEWDAPNLTISPKYRAMLKHPEELPTETRTYLGRMLGRAFWTIRSLERRRRTIMDVATRVFQHQTAFLTAGQGSLRPLTMQEVAEHVGVNVSTVSRAVANKYVETPQGVFPFRHFFLGSLPDDAGGSVSSDAVQQQIRQIIDNEDPIHPLSDETIAKTLATQGIQVARRTITKYRHLMGIADTASRRRKT